jgi:superfamily I DNA and RNA helicase
MKAGFRKDMIAVVSFRGREGSTVQAFDRLGAHSLRRFTGAYDGEGRPVVTDGEVLVDSVYRFKGRCAPFVVLTEVDFEALGEIETRKLFVGATRATMKLVVMLSQRAAAALVGRLGEE